MATLHDVLHGLADRVVFPSEAHAAAAHAQIDTIPEYVEQLVDEQLVDEQPAAAGHDKKQESKA